MQKDERTRVLGSIAQANEGPQASRPPVAPLSLVLGTLAALTIVVAVAFLVVTLPSRSTPKVDAPPSYLDAIADQYLKTEGHAKRGAMFEQLASYIAGELTGNGNYSASRIMALLGPPDLVSDAGAQGKTYVYLYDRFGTKDWAAYLMVPPGKPPTLGFNAVNATSHAGFKPYSK